MQTIFSRFRLVCVIEGCSRIAHNTPCYLSCLLFLSLSGTGFDFAHIQRALENSILGFSSPDLDFVFSCHVITSVLTARLQKNMKINLNILQSFNNQWSDSWITKITFGWSLFSYCTKIFAGILHDLVTHVTDTNAMTAETKTVVGRIFIDVTNFVWQQRLVAAQKYVCAQVPHWTVTNTLKLEEKKNDIMNFGGDELGARNTRSE